MILYAPKKKYLMSAYWRGKIEIITKFINDRIGICIRF